MTINLTLLVLLGALIGAAIGQKKKRAFVGVMFGMLLGPLGWLLVAVGPDMGRKCLMCGETVADTARKCRHCGEVLNVD